MDASFWHERWTKNETAFHEKEANPLLIQHFDKLALPQGSRVFIPLCGKTRDMAWLLSNGYSVAGAELSELAIGQLFAELGVKPEIAAAGKLKHYHAQDIDIFAGNIFDLSRELLGPVDAVYDRAALVALPLEMRTKYTAHLRALTNQAPQLLVCYEYDQKALQGPPFSISAEELKQHYQNSYHLTPLTTRDVPGGLKGLNTAKEHVWLLRKEKP